MNHQKNRRKLNRNATHRRALMRNLSRALIEHGRIITTVAKAKELRRFIEPLVTQAKKGTLHARRLVASRLPDPESVKKLFDEIGPRFAQRPGGYTRVLKRNVRRLGDAGETAFIEFLAEGEVKEPKVRRGPAPVAVTATPALPPAAVTPPTTEGEGEAPAPAAE